MNIRRTLLYGSVSLCLGMGVLSTGCGQTPTQHCDAADEALREYQLALAADNGPIAIAALEKLITAAEYILTDEFEASRLQLPLEEQVSVRLRAEGVKVFVLAFSRPGTIRVPELDQRMQVLAQRVLAEMRSDQ